jgi:hypothetical protein
LEVEAGHSYLYERGKEGGGVNEEGVKGKRSGNMWGGGELAGLGEVKWEGNAGKER